MTEEKNQYPRIGAPYSFNNAKELWDKCFEYFLEWEKRRRPITVIGLAGFLDVSRDTLNEYGKGTYDHLDPDFSVTIKKAKEYIETDKWEKMLTGEYKTAGAIFDLKNNHGARDTIEHVTKNGEAITQPQTIIVTESTIKNVVKKTQDEF